MGEVPRIRDHTLIIKGHIMVDIDCYNRTIRLVQVGNTYPRLCLIYNSKDEYKSKCVDVDSDHKFDELWKLLAQLDSNGE